MAPRVHHLSCATMCPYGASLFGRPGGPLGKFDVCAHVLLVETENALVLVDTGFGTAEVANPKLLGQPFSALMRPQLSDHQTAIRQVEALGFSASDVRHLVPTHLDIDHAGGLPDFPDAELHVFRPEMDAVLKPGLRERPRYMKHQFVHGPKWRAHDVSGDGWLGFEAVHPLPGVDPDVLIVPLPGHSRGHSAVAVKGDAGWLLHCGDAYFHRGQVQTPPTCPPGWRAFQGLVGLERKRRLQNEERLRELNERKGSEVRIFCAHDTDELESLRSGTSG